MCPPVTKGHRAGDAGDTAAFVSILSLSLVALLPSALRQRSRCTPGGTHRSARVYSPTSAHTYVHVAQAPPTARHRPSRNGATRLRQRRPPGAPSCRESRWALALKAGSRGASGPRRQDRADTESVLERPRLLPRPLAPGAPETGPRSFWKVLTTHPGTGHRGGLNWGPVATPTTRAGPLQEQSCPRPGQRAEFKYLRSVFPVKNLPTPNAEESEREAKLNRPAQPPPRDGGRDPAAARTQLSRRGARLSPRAAALASAGRGAAGVSAPAPSWGSRPGRGCGSSLPGVQGDCGCRPGSAL